MLHSAYYIYLIVLCGEGEIIFSNHETINMTTTLTQPTLPPTGDPKQGNK